MDAGSCKGDSGAPIFEYLEYQNQQFMVAYGVVHGCLERCCTTDHPTIFTNLGDKEVLDFVKNVGITINIESMTTKNENTSTLVYISVLLAIAFVVMISITGFLCMKRSSGSRYEPTVISKTPVWKLAFQNGSP